MAKPMPERPAPDVEAAADRSVMPSDIRAAMSDLASAFRRAGIDAARRDAQLLVAHAAHLSTAQVIAHPEHPLSRSACEWLLDARTRRLHREPVSRIIAQRQFWGQRLEISPAVLDPRPDSETVVDAVLEIIAQAGLSDAPIRLLDVGTGSGCLLLALLQELPGAFGIGSDISEPALAIARKNAHSLGLQARAEFACINALEAVGGPFDIVISNPPYLRSDEFHSLEPEVRRFDPALALDGGADGLDVYRQIASRLLHVAPNGWVALEIGVGQARNVADLLTAAGFISQPDGVRIYRDLAGHERCVAAKARNRA